MIDYQKELNPDQHQAVTFDQGPLLILAGAGSGKTRALTYRACYLVETKMANPDQILLLTFTNKAAQEMQERLSSLIGRKLPFAGTFHSFCARILRKHAPLVGYDHHFLIYDDKDQMDLVRQIIKRLDLPKQFKPRSVLSQIGSAKHEMLSPNDLASVAYGDYQQQIAQVYQEYQKQLKQNQAVDFDDLLLLVVKLLETQPQVLNHYQQQFKAILIDEYQDTNRAQYLIAKLLSEKHRQLTVVGDASQSIYRWRGADYRNLEYLQQDFPEITTIKLERNYRSSQTILDAAHAVISNNQTHPILKLWTDQKSGELIDFYAAFDEKAEAQYVVNNLNPKVEHSSAVLYRTNAQSRIFEEACVRSGLKYQLVGGTRFYERKEIKDVLAYLRLAVNPNDSVSRVRAEKIGKRRLRRAEPILKQAGQLELIELFDQLMSVTGYKDKYDINLAEDRDRLENIQELRAVASQFDSLTEFLENVALVEHANQDLDESQPQIWLMTIHASKGLEFDQIFLTGLEQGVFPHSRSLLEPADLEEERRLCYVALTRARQQLHLSYAKNRVFYGGQVNGQISQFVSEIPSHLLATNAPTRHNSKTNYSELDKQAERLLADEIDIDAYLDF